MKRYTWLIVPVLISLCCCNVEKKVLSDPQKTQNVVNAWLIKNPMKVDTTYKYLPGDTTTTLLFSYDTTTVRDTVTQIVERVITKTKVVTNTVHDTVQVTVKDNRLLQACQAGLSGKSMDLEQQKLETATQKVEVGKWKLRFWVVVSFLAILGLGTFFVKSAIKSPLI